MLRSVKKIIEEIDGKKFDESSLELALGVLTEKLGKGAVLWPLRVALSGEKYSPGPYELMIALGKSETIRRIEYAIQKLAD